MRGVTERKRVLHVTSEAAAQDDIAVSVRDSGPGIAAQDAARIFDAFFTTKQHGMGMGLAICKSIVEHHGGCIGVDSEPGVGSTFWFDLPRAAGQAN